MSLRRRVGWLLGCRGSLRARRSVVACLSFFVVYAVMTSLQDSGGHLELQQQQQQRPLEYVMRNRAPSKDGGGGVQYITNSPAPPRILRQNNGDGGGVGGGEVDMNNVGAFIEQHLSRLPADVVTAPKVQEVSHAGFFSCFIISSSSCPLIHRVARNVGTRNTFYLLIIFNI